MKNIEMIDCSEQELADASMEMIDRIDNNGQIPKK